MLHEPQPSHLRIIYLILLFVFSRKTNFQYITSNSALTLCISLIINHLKILMYHICFLLIYSISQIRKGHELINQNIIFLSEILYSIPLFFIRYSGIISFIKDSNIFLKLMLAKKIVLFFLCLHCLNYAIIIGILHYSRERRQL